VIPGARLIVLGKQGAGKGTQCVRLSHHYVIPHISTGDIFRGEVKHRTALGEEARSYMDAGELIPDEIVLAMVQKRLEQDDAKGRGFVFDGFPRTVAQAQGLRDLLAPEALDLVVNIVVPTGLVLRRLASRRVCRDCGTNYSLNDRPLVDWICNVCSGEVVQRDDDTPAAIKRRLDLYEQETAPLIAWYRQEGTLESISGVGHVDAVSERIFAAVDRRRDAGGPPPHWHDEHGEHVHDPRLTDGEALDRAHRPPGEAPPEAGQHREEQREEGE
jgi:adenylate kinase